MKLANKKYELEENAYLSNAEIKFNPFREPVKWLLVDCKKIFALMGDILKLLFNLP